jgi:UDP-2,3-diacylglucosamine hydrolase
VQTLSAAAQRLTIFLMHGNRDFLLGSAFAKTCNLTLLADPVVLDFADARWLLSHGDALCLADTDYMQFRSQVRSAVWQQEFLRLPLLQRQEEARTLRAQSEARKRSVASCVDLDASATQHWLDAAQAHTLIHGHTHCPADHALGNGLRRIALSDWDADATPARSEVLRLNAALASQVSGNLMQRLTVRQAAE